MEDIYPCNNNRYSTLLFEYKDSSRVYTVLSVGKTVTSVSLVMLSKHLAKNPNSSDHKKEITQQKFGLDNFIKTLVLQIPVSFGNVDALNYCDLYK